MKLPNITTLQIKANHPNLDGFRILHLSDLHLSERFSDNVLQELVTKCNAVTCHCIIITGDIIDTRASKITHKLHILNQLHDVYYISGNHDIFYGLNALKLLLDNFTFLDNQLQTILFNNKKIHLIGLADRFSKIFNIPRDVEKVLELSKNREALIFLAHQPKDYKIALQTQASLFLCGHTHGGQIFPFHYLVKLIQPYLSGLHYKNKMAIYVNSGLGTWGIHHRFKAPNEITLLQLSS